MATATETGRICGFVLALWVTAASATLAGTITGRARYDGPPLKTGEGPRAFLDMGADPLCGPKHDHPVEGRSVLVGPEGGLQNVLIRIVNPPKGDFPAPEAPVQLDQVGCLFTERMVVIRAGQTVIVRNSDGILHNVHGHCRFNDPFNFGMPAFLKQRSLVLDKPEGPFPVTCDVHPWMRTHFLVVNHPFTAVSTEFGMFEIRDLPPGEYQVSAWHEKLGQKTLKVAVTDSDTTRIDFVFKPEE